MKTLNEMYKEMEQNTQLIHMEKIPGTPFSLIRENNLWFTSFGNHRITEKTETKEEQLEKLQTEKWLLIMHMTIAIIQKMNDQQIQKEILEENEKYETESL